MLQNLTNHHQHRGDGDEEHDDDVGDDGDCDGDGDVGDDGDENDNAG